MKTLEEIALQVAADIGLGTTVPQQANLTEFARRLVAALGAQEPVGHYCVSYFRGCAGMANTEFQPSIDFAEGTHALYAAPYIKEGWQMVPKSPTPEMISAIEKQWMVGSQIDMAKREFKAAIAAAPEYKP